MKSRILLILALTAVFFGACTPPDSTENETEFYSPDEGEVDPGRGNGQ